ncbi:MAG: hypothetical protein A2741_02020 [Candidatus Zambryskibacteria bacterium RIFCSPHIGHO2_01_FULL_43_27]|uniref:HD domain-containing protein n=1 Tax=Candidatus Zambryskibacteria bacterium RIFCSPLOWO2_01_FULL_43_17 TaxID=1802760 RepID=A0A1G2U154_9BACT|nr:MAG: hypothetical protein A2741_02020 [Candidatus Zambryskibacteria bacterium RIFCSPHIGHO2_01_FULL_43_27]OHA99782.1 MAG: hypothetical protein A3E93_00915 [Candidatus Zambryskibacteria bacterium RIFCSPHIGHO2_12_FULL_43_12b]OHB03214.1 MAG: hypothetical protein A2920_02505 [Candidatus Zambryskibacteria bacterium RIFCSPLOWO2_01_FULL_43_17]
MYKEIDLSIFPPERETGLKNLYRYSMFEVMFYRPNLWEHSHRVSWLVEELAPVAQKYFDIDIEKARVLALVHNDAEMITGDVQAGHKARMTEEKLKVIELAEEKAIEILAEKYPKQVHGYEYRDLLMRALKKDSIEAQLVMYTDKLDALCESMHELFAGNLSFIRSMMFYVDIFAQFPKKFPQLTSLLSNKDSPFVYIKDRTNLDKSEYKRYKQLDKPYTQDSIVLETDFPFYDSWKKMVIKRGKIDWLLNQRELLPKSTS